MQFLVVLSGLVAAVAAQSSGLSSIVNRQCNTRYSVSPTSRIRTTTYRASITRTVSRTLVISGGAATATTVTPAPATFITTSTSTAFATVTAASSTDTFTSFQTVTQTSTSTVVQSFTTATTVLSTTFVAGVTRTIAAPSGFTALADSPNYEAKKRNAVAEKFANVQKRSAKKQMLPYVFPEAHKVAGRQAATTGAAQFPVGIQCTARTTYFATATTTTTIAGATGAPTTVTAAQPTIVRTVTVSTSGTQTVVPADATSFITVSTFVSTSVTSTSTFVSTMSNTVTIRAPASTQYAQCQANNQVSTAFAGNQIGTLTFNGDFTLQSVNVTDTTGAGCCTVCATTANCAGYAQAPATAGNACYYIVTDGRCDATQTFTDTYNYYQINTAGYTVGNAQCGQLGPQAGPPANQDTTPSA